MTPKVQTPPPDCLICSVPRKRRRMSYRCPRQATLSQSLTALPDLGSLYFCCPLAATCTYRYALEAPAIPGLFNQPIFGSVPGVHMSKIDERSPKAFRRPFSIAYENAAWLSISSLPSAFCREYRLVNPSSKVMAPPSSSLKPVSMAAYARSTGGSLIYPVLDRR